MAGRREWLEGLRPGDPVWVDSRALFMDRRLLREAAFVRWTKPDWPGWHSNPAIVRGDGLRRSPLVRPAGDGTFEVDSMDVCGRTEADADARHEEALRSGRRSGG